MTKLPLEIKRLIKRKKFSCDTSAGAETWRGGLKIDYRITHVVAEDEYYYPQKSPLNPGYSPINVNIKVKADIHNYLKLLGINSTYYQKIQVKKITWEK